jgi:hypothetical protein
MLGYTLLSLDRIELKNNPVKWAIFLSLVLHLSAVCVYNVSCFCC